MQYTTVNKLWATAMMALFLPRRAASRRYCAEKYVSLVWEAAQAAWDKARFSHGAP